MRRAAAAPPARKTALPPASFLASTQAQLEADDPPSPAALPDFDAPVDTDLDAPASEGERSADPAGPVSENAVEPAAKGPSAGAAGGAQVAGAAAPAPANRMFATSAAAAPAFGAAAGWQAAMAAPDASIAADGDADTAAADAAVADAEDEEMEEAEDVAAAVANAAPGSDEGALELFFLDAHYEPAQLGTVYMVGKVRQGGEHVSACVAVHHIKQTLFVVPKPFVFADADGDLAQCDP